MNTCNILFTSVGRRVSLIKHFRRALRELQIEGRIIGTDASNQSPAFYSTDKSYEVPLIEAAGYIPRLLELCSQEKIDVVIPLIDTELLLLAQNRRRFEDAGIKVIISTPEVVEIGMYKSRTYGFFKKNNINTPALFSPEHIATGEYRFPLIIKPDDGSAGKMVFKVADSEQLMFFSRYVPNAIVQEFITGDEYTVDVFIDYAGMVRCIVPRLRIEVRAGEVSKGLIVKNDSVIKAARKVAECLHGALGCITLQCILDTDARIKMVEINPRFGGGVPLSIEAGADFPKWTIQMVLGQEIGDVAGAYEDGLMMLRYDDAVFVKLPVR